MRVLWPHNFRTDNPNAGCFMHATAAALRLVGIDVTLHHLGNLRSIRGILRARAQVRSMSKEFDLVHAQYGSVCALATLDARRPIITYVRGNDWNLHGETLHWLWIHTRLARLATEYAIQGSSATTVVSLRLAAEITARHKGHRVEVVPAAIDLTRWVPRPTKPRLGRHVFRILFTATNPRDPIKRHSLMLKAVAHAQSKLGRITVVLASGIPHAEMPDLVASCDAVICTSETEGWPNSVKEALACNVPFVATDVSDLSEIARVEPTCRVCPAHPESLGNALCDVLTMPPPVDLRRHVSGMDLVPTGRRLAALYTHLLDT